MTSTNNTSTRKLNHLDLAAEMAAVLNHNCVPRERDFQTVAELHAAMEEAERKEAANEDGPNYNWTGAWPITETGTLVHTTSHHRMRVEVGDYFIRFDLLSPAYGGGEEPFCTVEVRDGVVRAEVVREARPIVAAKLGRIGHLSSYIAWAIGAAAGADRQKPNETEFVGAAILIAASDPWTARAMCRLAIADAEAYIVYRTEVSVTSDAAEEIIRSKERIAFYQARLQEVAGLHDDSVEEGWYVQE